MRSNPNILGIFSAALVSLPSIKRRNSDQSLICERSTILSRSASLIRIPVPEPRVSAREVGSVLAYASVSHPGKSRLINEDRVLAMSPVIIKRNGKAETLTNCSMFAIVDGTNGSMCAEFVKQHLFTTLTNEPAFLTDPSEALRHTFRKVDKQFLDTVQSKTTKASTPDRSGASVIVLIVVEDSCYIASLGNCRAVMSGGKGSRSYNLYREHTLNDEIEKKRVIKAGANVQRSFYETLKHVGVGTVPQPFRIYPGDLALTRALGHYDAKSESCGGRPKVILNQPDIRYFKLTHEHDYILIGSSGIFQTFPNKELLHSIWKSSLASTEDITSRLGTALSELLQESVEREVEENVSLLVVAFEGYVRQCR
eukprot:CAMPEP_0204896420 /NCGR_PEP_ID=MMETSP1397-20131031/153_1 /ASSEMBLY_ACC=CAM_ASM_000891 /TAXON_ID=49980 /ORGANISM="Climacostomum Climacostomum virens, Strain Stock W-24" /LENGTH=367 /DNA_ID=CAMNT_0052064023 /DNA_START=111 /DNA_END=1210 /DNA_ORIENTATION=-